ncbi:MAG TPA: STAS domain-containing protein [Variovorax sp.]|nr:STAS domain-containing protein [Variovorax sp.]
MPKEEPGRLLSKVAKFVRNPLKDWADLDAQEPVAGEPNYSREMVREMIERRQRNDSVRRREFDALRRMRQRGGGAATDLDPLSSLSAGSAPGRTEERAQTLRKIDEIEAQMSKHWWKSDPKAGDGSESVVHPEVLAAQRVRAYADTTPGIQPDHQPPVMPSQSLPSSPSSRTAEPARDVEAVAGADAALVASAIYDGALDEAALRFANRDDAGAEAVLLQALADDGALADHADTWLALLDLYCATGEAGKFGTAASRYAQRLRHKAPEWTSLPVRAADIAVAQSLFDPAVDDVPPADWHSPSRLGRADLSQLTRALSAAGASWTLDWRALTSIDAEAAGPLRVLLSHWADSPVDLRFHGAGRLEAVLEHATPLGDREVPQAWWHLRLAVLRAMHAVDAFEMAALHYCITYETAPPAWEEPRGRYAALEMDLDLDLDLDVGAADDAGGAAHGASGSPPAEAARLVLAGELAGESPAVWTRFDAELTRSGAAAQSPLVISCDALVRLDFPAAGALLNWVAAHETRGQRVRLVGVHRLVAAFLRVVGIAEHADIALRQGL